MKECENLNHCNTIYKDGYGTVNQLTEILLSVVALAMASNSPGILLSLFQSTWEGEVLDLSSRNSTKVQLFRSLEATMANANFHAVTCLWFLIFKGDLILRGLRFKILKSQW